MKREVAHAELPIGHVGLWIDGDAGTYEIEYDGVFSAHRPERILAHLYGPVEKALLDGTWRPFPAPAPQLFVDTEDPLSLLKSDAWWAQPKLDGVRVLTWVHNGIAIAFNRNGRYWPLPELVRAQFLNLEGPHLLDGELLKDQYVAFDLLVLDGKDLRGRQYRARFEKLVRLDVLVCRTAYLINDKHALLEQQLAERGEGIMFKAHAALYHPGRSDIAGRKWKFWQLLAVEVIGHNEQRSVQVGIRTGTTVQPVGDVSIPSNWDVPPRGSVVNVEYLYMSKHGRLTQPKYRGPVKV